jgi:hypothetical protein
MSLQGASGVTEDASAIPVLPGCIVEYVSEMQALSGCAVEDVLDIQALSGCVVEDVSEIQAGDARWLFLLGRQLVDARHCLVDCTSLGSG